MSDASIVQQETVADPLPYFIVFGILFIIALVALTWAISVWYRQFQCSIYPNIWCSDSWTCNSSCGNTRPDINTCFDNIQSTGLASCLYGPNAPGAHVCFAAPTGCSGSSCLACDCPTGMTNIPNCFSGCARTLSSVAGSQAKCCCKSGNNCTPC